MDEKKNNTAENPAFKAPENAPVRRVGTLTLGVCNASTGSPEQWPGSVGRLRSRRPWHQPRAR